MHKNTKYRLDVCERGLEPQHRMSHDLTNNRKYAETAIGVADRFFKFDFSKVAFSGFAREDDEYDGEPGDRGPCYYVEIWRDADLYCSVGFTNVGILGTLHVQLLGERDPKEALGQDLIGTIRETINRERRIPDGYQRVPRARVDGDHLFLNFDMRP